MAVVGQLTPGPSTVPSKTSAVFTAGSFKLWFFILAGGKWSLKNRCSVAITHHSNEDTSEETGEARRC